MVHDNSIELLLEYSLIPFDILDTSNSASLIAKRLAFFGKILL
jgi:hypothetical protein